MSRKFAAIVLIAILSGSVTASPVEANSGIVKAVTVIGKAVKWVFRGADDAADALKAAPKPLPTPTPAPTPAPALAVGVPALSDVRVVPVNKWATFVLDGKSRLAQIYDDNGYLVSTYPVDEASLADFELLTGKMTIRTLLKSRYVNLEGGELNLYNLAAKVGGGYLAWTGCNGTQCVGPILSKLLRCVRGTAQVSWDSLSGDLDFTCTAHLRNLTRS